MRKKQICLIVPMVFIITGLHYKAFGQSDYVEGSWSGTVKLERKYEGEVGYSEMKIITHFVNNNGNGTMSYAGELKVGNTSKTTTCEASGKAELHHLSIDLTDSIYNIHVIGAENLHCDPEDGGPGGDYQDIVIADQPLYNSIDYLSGTINTETDLPGGNKITTIISWNLTRSTTADVELIVTPEKYDTWLPEPGLNELTVGSVMNISFKLQAIGGGATTKKAKAFELHLFNTSKEPGITINFPIAPDEPMPDIRFLVQPNAAIGAEFQSLKINCPGGCQSSQAKIGSYDGGGWTVLKVEAILKDDNSRIQGKLLVSDGEIDIRIPKRDPNSKIAEKWLKENGNPDEMDDDEVSKGNSNDGDGLTAYEEYRGVISQGKFKRLNPEKKEVGILATQTDFTLFSEGLAWFKNASDLDIVRFGYDRNEIPGDMKLNANKKSAHDYDQCVLHILNGALPPHILGMAYTYTRNPAIPAKVIAVVASWNAVQAAYQRRVNNTRPEVLKFTLREYLAQTVAHELGHAINIWHHGDDEKYDPYEVPDLTDMVRIFDRNGNLITERSYTIENIGVTEGTVESGDMLCMLNYYPYYWWGYGVGADGAHIFNQEPLLPLGRKFCTSKEGTGINATTLYFGKAAKGNCLGQIKLRN